MAAEIEDDARREHVTNALLFNLARARSRAYEVDQDANHLRQAKDLLRKCREKGKDLEDELDAQILLKKTDAPRGASAERGARAREESAARKHMIPINRSRSWPLVQAAATAEAPSSAYCTLDTDSRTLRFRIADRPLWPKQT